MRTKCTRYVSSLLTLASAIAATQAVAQTAEPVPKQDEAAAKPIVEEIIVTAQRRNQSVNDVPATITAVAGDQLAARGVREFSDISTLAANVQIVGSYGGGNAVPNITIRGVGTSDFNDNNTSPAGVYIDEVYLVSPTMLSFGLFDLERVEVLKGPQGTLYGRNTTAGAVSIFSKRPGSKFEADGRIAYEEYNRFTIAGGAGGPVSDTLGIRVSGTGDFGGGWAFNRVSGKTENDRDYWALRGVARWQPNADISIIATVHGGRDRSELGQYQHGGLLDPVTGNICAAALAGRLLDNGCVDILGYADTDRNRSAGDYNVRPLTRYNSLGGSLRAEIDLGGVTVTSVSAYERLTGFRIDESDASPNRLVETRYATRVNQLSQELRLSFATGKIDWIVGGYYGYDTIVGDNDYDILRDLRPSFATIPGIVPSGFLPLGVDASGAAAAFFNSSFRQRTEAVAGFAHGIWELSPGLRFQAGLRYTSESKRFRTTTRYVESAADLAAYGLAADGTILNVPDSRTFSRLTWTAGISYEPASDMLLYSTVSNGFKSGGFNGGLLLQPEAAVPYNQEVITAYEIGGKFGLFDRRLQLNGSFFYYDYRDLQVFQLVNTGALPVQILTNAANARVYGIDAEARARLGGGITLRASAGFLSTKFVDANIAGVDRSGQQFTNSPKFSFSGGADYERLIGSSAQLRLSVNARYQTRQLIEDEFAPIFQQAYWIVDPRIAIGDVDDRWEFAVFARNVFNVRPITTALSLDDFGLAEVSIAPPRRVGASLSFRF
jgi:iron complex outermembrane recepter protein